MHRKCAHRDSRRRTGGRGHQNRSRDCRDDRGPSYPETPGSAADLHSSPKVALSPAKPTERAARSTTERATGNPCTRMGVPPASVPRPRDDIETLLVVGLLTGGRQSDRAGVRKEPLHPERRCSVGGRGNAPGSQPVPTARITNNCRTDRRQPRAPCARAATTCSRTSATTRSHPSPNPLSRGKPNITR